MRPFRHGLVSQEWQSHQIKWRIFYIMCHPAVCCRVSRGSRTRRPLLELQRGRDFLYDPQRIGPSSSKNTRSLQQCHCRRHCEQHRQTTRISLDGNEIFWVCDKVAQDVYDIKWHPGKENLADYQSKRHIILLYAHGIYTRLIHPWFYQGQADLAL